jgi:4-hydroxybenzoate polyprenyltransferase
MPSLRFQPVQRLQEKVALYADFVKFEHSVFALPFALSATLLATGPINWPHPIDLLWIVLAMLGGRTYAMGFNRLVDRHIDAQNPRTAVRALPAGKLKLLEAWAITVLSLVVMTLATMQLPPLCLQLLPLAILIMTVYSYFKRFSWLAHFVLGLALGCGAIGGWVATTGVLPIRAVVWGVCILFWVAGFDLIYACQDAEFDRQKGLFSIPACFGVDTALWLSRLCHVATIVGMAAVGWKLGWVGPAYWVAVALSALLLAYEQSLVRPNDLSRVNEAFFLVNGVLSIVVFLLILSDRIWP